MKNVMIIAALALAAAAGTASAYAIDELPATYAYEARTFVPEADFSNLTSAQVNQIETVLSGSTDHADVAGSIRKILGLN